MIEESQHISFSAHIKLVHHKQLLLTFLIVSLPTWRDLWMSCFVFPSEQQRNGHEMDKKMGVFSKQKIPGKPDPSVVGRLY